MTVATLWRPLAEELDRALKAGRSPRFWLRDDDAVEPRLALDRLLVLTGAYRVPLALAVIPAHTGQALADRLAVEPGVTVLVHGWSHENHAPPGVKKQELGLHRPAARVCAELASGLSRLRHLHGTKLAPVVVPPWNRIDATLVERLPALGFEGLSVFGAPFAAPLAVINSTVDIMDWHGTGGCRDHASLVAEIVSQLRAGQAGTIGILTHHLVHDEAAWAFLAGLFEVTDAIVPRSWRAMRDLMAARSPG